MDPGEAAVLFGVVLLCLLLISGLMVSDCDCCTVMIPLTSVRLERPGCWEQDST